VRRLLSVLFWAVIPAAFIGPGTVTTAAAAGASHGYALLWALLFSTLATLVLQEASARVTVVSGRDLSEAIRDRYRGGAAGLLVLLLVVGAVVLGNAAYEAGNVLGAAAGARLGAGIPPRAGALLIGAAAFPVLWFGTTRAVTRVLAATVALMGVAFLVTAVLLAPPAAALARGSLVPVIPPGGGLLVLGLVGTTVVPYNLFLGSGIARGRELGEVRFGLTAAVVLGGLISMSIVVSGAALGEAFSYDGMAAMLSGRLGPMSGPLFAWGLFAAGFSSCLTAPLAAAITASSLFATGEDDARWGPRGALRRAVWIGVLGVGLAFGVAGVRPIPAILLAQALNGVLLPFVAVFLFVTVNDRRLMGERGLNGPAWNALTGVVVAATLLLGVSGVVRAAAALSGGTPSEGVVTAIAGAVAAVLLLPVTGAVRRARAAG
jgi:manganese transport protein